MSIIRLLRALILLLVCVLFKLVGGYISSRLPHRQFPRAWQPSYLTYITQKKKTVITETLFEEHFTVVGKLPHLRAQLDLSQRKQQHQEQGGKIF